MILPGHVVQEYVEQQMISVQPEFDARQLRPFGLRVHLGPVLLLPDGGQRVDLAHPEPSPVNYREHDLRVAPFVLPPNGFLLGSTIELFKLHPSLMCRLEGRSTLARLGLLSHCSAGVIDSNHQEHRAIVLEIANVGPFEIVIPHGIAIGMATFERVAGEAEDRFDQSQYEGQRYTLPPNLRFTLPPYSGLRKP